MRPVIMVLITSNQADDEDEAVFEAEEAVKLETGSLCASPHTGFVNPELPVQEIISSKAIGLSIFANKLSEYESVRRNLALETIVEFAEMKISDVMHLDSHDIWQVSQALSMLQGGFDSGLPCWDAENQTSDLSRAISELSEDEEYWLIPIEI